MLTERRLHGAGAPRGRGWGLFVTDVSYGPQVPGRKQVLINPPQPFVLREGGANWAQGGAAGTSGKPSSKALGLPPEGHSRRVAASCLAWTDPDTTLPRPPAQVFLHLVSPLGLGFCGCHRKHAPNPTLRPPHKPWPLPSASPPAPAFRAANRTFPKVLARLEPGAVAYPSDQFPAATAAAPSTLLHPSPPALHLLPQGSPRTASDKTSTPGD